MVWSRLDDKFHSHPKVLAAGNGATGLYARALSYCGDHLTDGHVSQAWAEAAGTREEIDALEAAGLWKSTPSGYLIPDFLVLNPSRKQVADARERRSQAGQAAATRRWHGDKLDERPGRNPGEHPRDELWDALAVVFGDPATTTERGKRNRAIKELRAAEATADQIRAAAKRWPGLFPDATPTDMALVAHWARLTAGKPGVTCGICGAELSGPQSLDEHERNVHGKGDDQDGD